MRKPISCLLAILAAASQIRGGEGISPAAKTYLDGALKIMQENFVYKGRVDWEQVKHEALVHAGDAQLAVETYPAIRFALAKLGDHHSFLQLTPELMKKETALGLKPAAAAAPPAKANAKAPNPLPSPFRARRVPEGAMVAPSERPIAQIVIPMFSGPDLDGFATKIQSVVAELATQHPCGWIVDLRGNGGGNMWPMLAGVGPILGEGEPGGFLHGGVTGKWFYENGLAGERKSDRPYYAKTNGDAVRLSGTPPVAVLIDRDTGSSGEGIAVAFRGRAETRFFGETTYGVATSTFPFPLGDGAQIFVVSAVMVDRNGKEYRFCIDPDQEILADFSISSHDPVIRGASEWLSGQKACKGY